MGRALAVAVAVGCCLGLVLPVGVAGAVEPSSSVGVATGKALRAGWYEDITGECSNVKDAVAGLFGSVTGGNGSLAFATGTGLVGATSAPAATSFGAQFLGTVGAGGAAVTAAQAAAVAAVGVTGFCTGLLGAQWITGKTPYVAPSYTGPFFSYNAGVIPCAQISGFVSAWEDGGSMCQRFSPAQAEYAQLYSQNQFGEVLFGNQNGWPWRFFTRTWAGTLGGTWQLVGEANSSYLSENSWPGIRSKDLIYELSCRSAALCAGVPNSSDGGSLFAGVGNQGETKQTAPVTGSFLNSGAVPTRLQARSYCQSPAGQTQLFNANGAWSEAGNTTAPAVNGDLCPAGWLKLTYNLDVSEMPSSARQSCGAAGLPVCVDLASIPTSPATSLISWVIPTYVQSNPVLRQCYLDGFTNCEATSADGITTVNNTVTNQTTNVTVGGPQQTVTQVLEPIRDAIATGPSPTTVPNTSPTTVAPTTVPATTVPVTSAPTTVPCGIACEGSDPEPPPGDNDSCFTEGYSWNPVSWVLVPIKCAFTWLFVPSGANWDSVTDDLDAMSDDAPLSWVVGASDLLTGSSVQFVRWSQADLPSFTVGGYTFDFASLDGAEAPTVVKVLLLIAVWILLAYAIVRFL